MTETSERRAFVVAALLGSIVAGIIVAIALQVLVINPKADSTERGLRGAVSSIVAVQIKNCRADHRFRLQYKKRGEAEQLLLRLFLDLAEKTVKEGKDPTGTSRGFVAEFGPLTKEIHIIPVPSCKVTARRLRAVVEHAGLQVPPVLELEELAAPTAPTRSSDGQKNHR